MAVDAVVNELKNMSSMVTTPEEISQVLKQRNCSIVARICLTLTSLHL